MGGYSGHRSGFIRFCEVQHSCSKEQPLEAVLHLGWQQLADVCHEQLGNALQWDKLMTRWPAVQGGMAWRGLADCGGLRRAMRAGHDVLLGGNMEDSGNPLVTGLLPTGE